MPITGRSWPAGGSWSSPPTALLRAFDPTNGSLTHTAEIPGGAAAQPAVAGGILYVVGGNGQLHAFR